MIEREEILLAIEQGYIIAPYYDDIDLMRFDDIKRLDLTVDILKKFARLELDEYDYIMSEANSSLVMIRLIEPYQVNVDDVIHVFTIFNNDPRFTRSRVRRWISFLRGKISDEYFYIPHFSDEELDSHDNDYYFDNPHKAILFAVGTLYQFIDEHNVKEIIDQLLTFLIEVKDNAHLKIEERLYSPNTLAYLLESIAYNDEPLPKEVNKYFMNHLIRLASENNEIALRVIGYQYYEGLNGFPLDYEKALFYLEKSFAINQNPDLARTIGYIYYYDRTHIGDISKDKAFKYFAVSHFSGRYYEATYKLSDCLLHGYGVPKSEQGAFNLVKDIYQEVENQYLEGNNRSKFADVALRLGNFYHDAVFVEQDLSKALIYYLKAFDAIKNRLKVGSYIGDNSIALSLFNKIREYQFKERIIKNNGYQITLNELAPYINQNDFSLSEEDNRLIIRFKPNLNDNCFVSFKSIGYIERNNVVSIYVDTLTKKIINNYYQIQSWDNIVIYDDYIDVFYTDINDNNYNVRINYNNLYYIPNKIVDATKQYLLAGVRFNNNGKLYYYLADPSISINEVVATKNENGEAEVIVDELLLLYEDQLPLPLNKLGRVYKKKNFYS